MFFELFLRSADVESSSNFADLNKELYPRMSPLRRRTIIPLFIASFMTSLCNNPSLLYAVGTRTVMVGQTLIVVEPMGQLMPETTTKW